MSTIYEPLNPGRHDIRLLRVTTSANRRVFPRTINCALETVSLDDRTDAQYIALSYMWGPAPPPENASSWPDIYVDGELFPVTANLNLALIHLYFRYDTNTRFWIDAICINQNDETEKGHQVGLMREIYTYASEVWAWQIPTEACKLAMDFLAEASVHQAEDSRVNSRWTPVSTTWLRQQLTNAEIRSTWDGLVQLLSQPYWRRNWIIQELFVNNRVQIVCGHNTASLEVLAGVLDGLFAMTVQGGLWASTIIADIQVSSYDCAQVLLLKNRGSDTLYGLVQRFINSSATDPRDKIYSLIGIATPYPGVELRPDYGIEWPEVFYNATKYIIQGSGNLDVLASSASGSDELPSWVPNFAKQNLSGLSTNNNERTPSALQQIGVDYAAGGRLYPMALFSNDRTELTVNVMLVHTLSHILPPQQRFGPEFDPIAELRRRLQFLVILFLEFVRTPGSRELPEEAVVTQLCAYVCLRFYQATMLTTHLSALVQQVWPTTEFVRFCLRVIPGEAQELHCTPEQLDFLKTALLPLRSLFCCQLPAPLSLLDDFQTAFTDITHVQPETIATLRQCKFLAPGYCRNRQGLGRHGDIVSIVLGCNVPLLLRPVSEPGKSPVVMRVVSEAYVQGIMHGETLNKYPVHQITLV